MGTGNARNNLPNESQRYFKTLQADVDTLKKQMGLLQSLNLNKQVNRLATGVGNSTVKVVPIWEQTTDSFLSVETPALPGYDFMTLVAQITLEAYFTPSGSARTSNLYLTWFDDVFPITGLSENVLYIPAGAGSDFSSMSVGSSYRITDWQPGGLGISLDGQSTISGFAGWSGNMRITGSIIYTKENS